MTNEEREREALISGAREVIDARMMDAPFGARYVAALLSALDEARGKAQGVVTLDHLDRVLAEYPDADVSKLVVSAEEALRVEDRARVQRESRRRWIDAITYGLGESETWNSPDEAGEAVAKMRRERDEARRDLTAARTELLDLDLVLPVACGSRVDAAQHLADAGARADRDLGEARGQLAALHAAMSSVNVGRGYAEAWFLTRVLRRLADAADHLLNDHSCDAHGYEGVVSARDAAREHADALDRAFATVFDAAAAAKAYEARVREPVERERDAAIARADAAEKERDEARTLLSVARGLAEEAGAEAKEMREQRDVMATALASLCDEGRALESEWEANNEGHIDPALERFRRAIDALPADLAAQRDARVRAEVLAEVRAALVGGRSGYFEWSHVARTIDELCGTAPCECWPFRINPECPKHGADEAEKEGRRG